MSRPRLLGALVLTALAAVPARADGTRRYAAPRYWAAFVVYAGASRD